MAATTVPRLPNGPSVLVDWAQAKRAVESRLPLVLAKAADVSAAESKVAASRAPLLPQVALKANAERSTTPSEFSSSIYGNEAAALNVTVPVLDVSAWRKTQTSEYQAQAASARYRDSLREAYALLVDRVIAAVGAERLFEVATENLKSSLEIQALSEHASAVGLAAKVDVLRARQQVFDATDAVWLTYDLALLARQKVGEALGSSEAWQVKRDLAVSYHVLIEACSPIGAIGERADIRAAHLEREAAARLPADESMALLPRLSVTMSESYSRIPDANLNGQSLKFSGIVGAEWTLFDGGLTLAKIRGAEAVAQSARAAEAKVKIEATQKIVALERSVLVMRQKLEIATLRRTETRELLHLVYQGILQGHLNSLDQTTAQVQARQAELSVVALEFELMRAEASLELSLVAC